MKLNGVDLTTGSAPMHNLAKSAGRAAAFVALMIAGMALMHVLTNAPMSFGRFTIMGIVMAVDLLLVGWNGSSLGRLLRPGDKSTANDAFYFMLMFSGLFSFLMTGFSFGLDHGIDALTQLIFWPTPDLIHVPMFIGIPLMYTLRVLAAYFAHRLMHTRWLWPLHAVHHAPAEMTLLNTYRVHPLEMLVGGTFDLLPGLLYGLDPLSALALGRAIAVLAFWQHSNIPNPFPWIERWLLAGPINHRIHHARADHLHNCNFADIPLIDRLFGTYTWTDEAVEIGVNDPAYGRGNPLAEMVMAQWRCIKALLPRARTAGALA